MPSGAGIKKYELLANKYDIDLFLQRINNTDEDACWIWDGAKVPSGYGYIRRNKNGKEITIFAHRLMYTIHYGEIPDEMVIDHRCHSEDVEACLGGLLCTHRLCVNPKHLRAITAEENKRMAKPWRGGVFPESSRKFRRERRGTCRKGHLWVEENMIQRKSGRVDCLPCRKNHSSKNKVGV